MKNAHFYPTLQGGFTFLELIIVATIISMLATVTLPLYHQYQNRAKVSEAFSLSATARSQIADFYRKTGDLPVDNTAAGLPLPHQFNGNYIQSLSVQNGVIVLTFGQQSGELNGKILSLHPRLVIDSPTTPLAFHCGKVSKPLPKGITVLGDNQTTLPDNALPTVCR